MTNAKDDELAQLKARVEELERATKPKPEPEPFKSEPHQRYDPTAGMSMPPSAIEAMVAAEPKGFMAGVVGDNRAPTTPETIPRSEVSRAPEAVKSATPGYVDPQPLTNPPGTFWVDAIGIADAARERAELKRKLGK
jgi:hypothetical protein